MSFSTPTRQIAGTCIQASRQWCGATLVLCMALGSAQIANAQAQNSNAVAPAPAAAPAPTAVTFTATATATARAAPPAPARQWLSPPPGDAARGAALYQSQCTACHSVDASKIGPAHRGVLGRRIGSLAVYKYSTELAASRLRWTPQTLFAWLGDPEDLVAGQRMGFAIEDAQQRGDLIAYLATLN